MSTVAEIEAAIEQLPPEEFHALKEWIVRRAGSGLGRTWTPEELGAAAQRMVDEPAPAKARTQWEAIRRGFYGEAEA